MTAYQITTARNKYWIPYRFDGTSFIELDAVQLGDVNDDGQVNITDVTILINAVMTENFGNINTANADMNGDGTINITDVTILINQVMNN